MLKWGGASLKVWCLMKTRIVSYTNTIPFTSSPLMMENSGFSKALHQALLSVERISKLGWMTVVQLTWSENETATLHTTRTRSLRLR